MINDPYIDHILGGGYMEKDEILELQLANEYINKWISTEPKVFMSLALIKYYDRSPEVILMGKYDL